MNGLNGRIDRVIWRKYLVPREHNTINVVRGISVGSFDQLSKSDIRILNEVWESFGGMTPSQIRQWTHDNCPEYTLIERGRVPISLIELARATGFEDPSQLEVDVSDYRYSELALS
jgi:hypothetical protein